MPSLNDVQSKLNPSDMRAIARPLTVEEISRTIIDARDRGISLCPAGALHSMGGQQFLEAGVSLSSERLSGIGPLDRESQTVWVQSGVTWPSLVRGLREQQRGETSELSIIQKQTGADELTLGGALSSNIHGRVLGHKPIVEDIESFYLTGPDGARKLYSREEGRDLFQLAVGGYGLFGFVDSIKLRLQIRQKLVRRVREVALDEAIPALEDQARRGAAYGDFQYKTDEASVGFMAEGIMSTYSPEEGGDPDSASRVGLSTEDWSRLYVLAHTDKARAYQEYARHYFQTDGQAYWSDDHQFSPYLPEAGDMLYRGMGWKTYASLMITELYIPRTRFVNFMAAARRQVLATQANLVYGTVRLIEAERETLLRWATQDYACVIFNLLVEHSPEGVARGQAQFRALIDCALAEGGSYYLTYHRWARKDQVERAYPQFPEFLRQKRRYDPDEVFASDWLRHYQNMFE